MTSPQVVRACFCDPFPGATDIDNYVFAAGFWGVSNKSVRLSLVRAFHFSVG